MNKIKIISLSFYSFILFFLFISSLNPWFLWGKYQIFLILLLVLFPFFLLKNIELTNKKIFTVLVLFFFELYMGINGNFNQFILQLIQFLFFSILIFLDSKTQFQLLDRIIKLFVYSLIISYIVWLISFQYNFQYYDIISYDNNFYYFYNYIFYLQGFNEVIFTRFQGFYLEPGHLGMIISFILFVRQYNFSSFLNIILLVFLISTFSLVGYLLFLFGFLLQIAKKNKNFNLIFITILFFIVLFFISDSYNDGDNLLNNLIFSRLEFDENKLLAGNNRTSDFIDNLYNDLYKSDDFILGLSSYKLKIVDFVGSAGYKVFIIQYGILGILITFLTYYLFLVINKNKFSNILFFLFIINFFQRSYPEWSSFLIIFIFANSYVNITNKNNDKNCSSINRI